jgi:hypothetical protein
VVEDGWVGRKTRNRKLLDVTLKGAIVQKVARYIVQPETLTEVPEQFCRFHPHTILLILFMPTQEGYGSAPVLTIFTRCRVILIPLGRRPHFSAGSAFCA